MMTAADLLATVFGTLPDLIRASATDRPARIAIADDTGSTMLAPVQSACRRRCGARRRSASTSLAISRPISAEIVAWTNARLGKTQRLSGIRPIKELYRSAIGKVLKRELRDRLKERA